MPYSVNRPSVLSAVGVSAKLRITALPSGPGAALGTPPSKVTLSINGGTILTPQPALLVVNDCADLPSANSGNVIWSTPLSALAGIAEMTVDLGITGTGLVVSAVPPGVAAIVEF
jgi:hypothetical protein